MHIISTADLHGKLPAITGCDLLLIAGDVCPVDQSHELVHQRHWLRTVFTKWLNEQPAKHIVWIAGNHDFACEQPGFQRIADTSINTPNDSVHYLCDDAITIEGIKIYGTPWVPNLPNWAFHANDQMLQTRFDDIPEDTDILLCHGPPDGILDRVGWQHVGAPYLMSRLQKVLPEYVIFGHIHEGYGRMQLGGVEFKNVAHMNELYEPINPPQTFKITQADTQQNQS